MMKAFTKALFIGAFFLSPFFIQAQEKYTPKFKTRKKDLFKIKNQNFTFGYLEVPENRSVENSRTIKLPVYIFKSRSENPNPDPIIYTVGGPGSTTMPSAQYMKYYQYLDDRDFILFEQRGTYYAKPHLACPEWGQAIYRINTEDLEDAQADSLLVKAAAKCKNALEKSGVDLNGYNTNESAADIADLRKALGIEAYNLLTLSYSTKIAQVLMRDYPEGIRSVVMDSPLPLEVNYDEESVQNILVAMNKLLDDCTDDTSCNEAYPDLKRKFKDYLIAKTENPLNVEIELEDGSKHKFLLSGEDLILVFTNASTGEVADIPHEMNRLLNNDLGLVKETLKSLFNGPGNGAGIGMRLSVWCAEEYPFVNQETVLEETNKYPELRGLLPAVFSEEVCDIWSVAPVEEKENKPIKSDIPVLLLTGSYDNETPTQWAQEMAKNLKNSFHLDFHGWRHGITTNWSNTCGMKTANAFFNNPYKKPEFTCFDELKQLDFKVDY